MLLKNCDKNDSSLKFQFMDMGNGYKLRAISSGRSWDIQGGSKDNNARLQTWDNNNEDGQRFYVVKEDTYWKFVVRRSNRCIAIPSDAGSSPLVNVFQYDCGRNQPNQQFNVLDA